MNDTQLIIAYVMLIIGIFQLYQAIKWLKDKKEDIELWKRVNKVLDEQLRKDLHSMLKKDCPRAYKELNNEDNDK